VTEESSTVRSLADRIRYSDRGYTGVQEAIARALVADPARAIAESIEAFSGRIGVSSGSVVRFARMLGFSGYRELKYALAADGGWATTSSAPPPILASVFEEQARAVQFAGQCIAPEVLQTAADLLLGARRVDIVGVGAASATARAAEFQFAVLGLHCRRLEDPGEAAAAAASLERGDVLLAISHSGRTRSVVDAARRARSGGASVTAITSAPRSVLARLASLSLGVDAAQTRYASDEMPFRLAHLAIVQVLATTIAARLQPAHLSARRARWAGARFDLRYGNDHDPRLHNR